MNIFKKILCILLTFCLLNSGCIMAFAAEESGTIASGSSGGIIVDEDASADLVLYGDSSKQEDGIVQLTPLATWRSGSVWYGRQIDAASGFTTKVDYWAGGGRDDFYGGADGFVVTFAETTGLGSDGEYLGFVSGSYGVELDSYCNNPGDPGGKHIGIIQNAVSNHLTYVLDDRVDDSQWHTLEINYTPGTLTVCLDGGQVLTQEGVSLPDAVYLGISAATGAGKNRHLIRNFYMEGIVSEGESLDADTDPIIIIPGIMGSRLFTSDTVFDASTRVWNPPTDTAGEIWDVHNLDEYLNNSNTLYVRPCENQNDVSSGTVAIYGREYGALDIYKNLVDGLCESYPDREIYVFSYDWRKSNAESAQKLDIFIDSLNSEKVDLVCHSMGGLVVSSYYSQYVSEGRIDKIITCGTPYEGAPKLLNSVQNWDVLGEGGSVFKGANWLDLALGVWGGMTKSLKSSFSGVVELTPTKNYVQEIPMQRDSWIPFNQGDYELTYSQYVEICNEIFGNVGYSVAQSFQRAIQGSSGYNALLDYDKSYFLIGVNQKTITSIKFQYANTDIDQRLYESDLTYDTWGDGTVPYLSASIMEQVEKLDSSRWVTRSVDHTGTVTNRACIEWVSDILKYGVSTVNSDNLSKKDYIVVRIACPVDVTITSDGEVLSSCPENLSCSASFGRLDILGENDEIKLLCIDAGAGYDIEMNGTGEGTMNYSIRFFSENGNLQDERTFEDVPITENTVINTDVVQDEKTVLNVDYDGDSTVDVQWIAQPNEWITASEDERIPMTGINLNLDQQTIVVGESSAIKVAFLPLDTTDKAVVTYTSSEESVVAVDESGVITGIAEGTAVITATTSNGYTAEVEVTVIAAAKNPFTDVSSDAYYYEAVLWAVENSITEGYGTSGTIFAPDMNCTRAQVVTFLWRAAGCPEPTSEVNTFADVNEKTGDWYYKAVLWAVENGITAGYGSDTIFNPDGACTRAQVATFMWRAAGKPDMSSAANPFTDLDTEGFYYDAVLWAVESGITNGYGSDTIFNPDGICTRGQIVTFLYRGMK